MRVISGKYRGKILYTVDNDSVRPTADRVKENIFNLLQGRIVRGETTVLDLFAGSGALGIEALSRGAEEAVFVDKSKASMEAVKYNLKKIDGKSTCILKDYKGALSELSLRKRSFDIIFLDPPYGKIDEKEILTKIEEYGTLKEDGVIVLERKRDSLPVGLPKSFAVADERSYGASSVLIIKRATKALLSGTFDPFTNGHRFLLDKALDNFDYVHIVIFVNPDKTPEFALETRKKIIADSVKDVKTRVVIGSSEKLTIDYCAEFGIEYIVRGYRNEQDFVYEKQMADWNFTNGGVKTMLIPAEDALISSTLVRDGIKNGDDVSALVSEKALKKILGEGKKWKI